MAVIVCSNFFSGPQRYCVVFPACILLQDALELSILLMKEHGILDRYRYE